MTPEAITAEEKQDVNSRQLPVNPGDVIDESQSIEEKADQLGSKSVL